MTIPDPEKLFPKLEKMGEETVRLKLAQGAFAPQRKRDLVLFWLSNKERERQQIREVNNKSREIVMKPDSAKAWDDIKKDYDVSKRTLGKKINFVTDPFKRKIIFRDVEQAYLLAKYGFTKSAVILAGGVIEELLRIYLEYKNIRPNRKSFDSYIQSCENNRLFKSAISKLTESVRHFRNLVHLEKESSSRSTISKATAKGAVSSIFTIVNDF
jgi:hypothetical protein